MRTSQETLIKRGLSATAAALCLAVASVVLTAEQNKPICDSLILTKIGGLAVDAKIPVISIQDQNVIGATISFGDGHSGSVAISASNPQSGDIAITYPKPNTYNVTVDYELQNGQQVEDSSFEPDCHYQVTVP